MLPTADNIPREPVDSSNILSRGYSAERQVLAVEFKSGALFHYSHVDAELAQQFLNAPSAGTFYAKNIKGKYFADKMSGPCRVCNANGIVDTACGDCGQGVHVRIENRREAPALHEDQVDQVRR